MPKFPTNLKVPIICAFFGSFTSHSQLFVLQTSSVIKVSAVNSLRYLTYGKLFALFVS